MFVNERVGTMRFSRQGWVMFAGVVMVAMISQVTLAQREEGRRGRGGRDGGGFGGPSGVRLLSLKEVQTALKLTDEQKDKITKINDQMRDDIRKAFDDGTGREKMQELNASAAAKVNEVLDAGQQKRLMGILIQVAGAAATSDPAVAKELNITDDQKKQLETARQSNMEAMRKEFDGARDQTGSREEMRAKFDKLREEANKKLMAVLTSDQQAQLEALKGEKVEIDMAQLRGGGGPGGRGGDRRPGGARGDRNPESKSEGKSSN
jgi:Spy/CpxP family protein refolding chaperone